MDGSTCVAIPAILVNCILIWLFLGVIGGTILNKPVSAIFASLLPIGGSYEESYELWSSSGYFAAIIGIAAIACYFIFMYPDMKEIQAGVSSCGSVITPLGD